MPSSLETPVEPDRRAGARNPSHIRPPRVEVGDIVILEAMTGLECEQLIGWIVDSCRRRYGI